MISFIRKNISNLIKSFQEAKKAQQIPLWLVTAYAFYIPFEDYINSLIPISAVRSLLSFVPENIFYATVGFVIYDRCRFRGGVRKTPIDPLIIALILSVLVSIFFNGASPPGSFKNLRVHFRYIAVYYILVNIDLPQSKINYILNKITLLGIFEAALSSIQFFLPTSVNLIISSEACKGIIIGKGANCGTFNDNAILAAFLLVILIFYFTIFSIKDPKEIPNQKTKIAAILLFVFSIFASKKRASFMISLILPLVIYSFLKKRMIFFKYLWLILAGGLIGSLALSLIPSNPDPLAAAQQQDLSSFSSLFTEEYWRANAENSRGWMIIITMNALIKSGHIWFGFGPELGIVPRGIEVFLHKPDEVAQLYRNLYVFEDPYWFAILAYTGIVGLIIFWLILLRLSKIGKYLMNFPLLTEEKAIIVTLRTLIVTAFFYCFAERLFMIRTFSFYFWLFAGIMVNRFNYYRSLKPSIQPKLKT